MKRPFLYSLLLYSSLIGSAILLCFVSITLSADPMRRWWFRPQAPAPSDAIQIATLYPSNEVQRIIQLEIPRSAPDQIQQFYRTELPKQGWSYRCTDHSPLNTGFELMDRYEQRTPQNKKGQTLLIEIGKQKTLERQNESVSKKRRLVQVTEWLTIVPADRGCTSR